MKFVRFFFFETKPNETTINELLSAAAPTTPTPTHAHALTRTHILRPSSLRRTLFLFYLIDRSISKTTQTTTTTTPHWMAVAAAAIFILATLQHRNITASSQQYHHWVYSHPPSIHPSNYLICIGSFSLSLFFFVSYLSFFFGPLLLGVCVDFL